MYYNCEKSFCYYKQTATCFVYFRILKVGNDMKRFFYVKLFTFHFSVLNYPYYKDETTKCSTCGIPLGFFYVWVVFAKKDTINYKKNRFKLSYILEETRRILDTICELKKGRGGVNLYTK